MKITYEIHHFNPKGHMQYNSFHCNSFHCNSVQDAIEKFEAKGFSKNNIRNIKVIETQFIPLNELIELLN